MRYFCEGGIGMPGRNIRKLKHGVHALVLLLIAISLIWVNSFISFAAEQSGNELVVNASSLEEHDWLISLGWIDERIGWYSCLK